MTDNGCSGVLLFGLFDTRMDWIFLIPYDIAPSLVMCIILITTTS